MTSSPFKAYDVRGRVPEELDPNIAYKIGRAFAVLHGPGEVAVGRDVRASGPMIVDALTRGITEGGVDVCDLGLCGTEEIYHAAFANELAGGIMVTASHNPPEYNGMKFVGRGGLPISGDSGLNDIRELTERGEFVSPERSGYTRDVNLRTEYVEFLIRFVEVEQLKPLKIIVNSGNGCAGPVVDALERELPFDLVKVEHEPDGTFPNGVPNPLLVEKRKATSEAVLAHGADLGVAWDGDFDRCFFFDERGSFVEGYYVVGLLARMLLEKNPGAKIVHDPRLVWNTLEIVKAAGGVPVQSKTGHAFIKERMRLEDGLYGGEMSAHHYFRDFNYCDSGMIPFLLVAELLSVEERPLSKILEERIRRFPVSGEINRRAEGGAAIMKMVEDRFVGALVVDRTDGLGMEFEDYRFNLRLSNTEPLIRLNVETRGDRELMARKTREILNLIDKASAEG